MNDIDLKVFFVQANRRLNVSKYTMCYLAYLAVCLHSRGFKVSLMTEQLEITKLIRETRQRLGLTQEQFALKLGVSYQSVNRWENGRTKPLPLAMKQIKQMLKRMGDRGKDLLDKYFPSDLKNAS